jgi:hypothetical protein
MAKKTDSGLLNLTGGSSKSSLRGNESKLSIPSSSQSGFQAASEGKNTGIHFGNPSVRSQASTATGSAWSTLLKQTASNGLASAVSGFGTGTLASLGGLGSLVSGVMHLFSGSHKTSPTLQDFSLPVSQNTTAYVGRNGTTVYDGPTTLAASPSTWTQDHSAQVAQAVKTALLHSSSLNDIIAEI